MPLKAPLPLLLLAAFALVQPSPVAQVLPESDRPTTRSFNGVRQSSHYVMMRDGVRLAVDVHLPAGLAKGERTATILHLTRYYRSLDLVFVYRPFMRAFYTVTERDTRVRMVKAGYSWVDVDVRGTGASFGRWDLPLSPQEVQDGADVIDWIVKQPWSAGVVGATGGSYNASLAVMLLATEHPALKAVVTRFAGWDMYEDVFAPGGLQHTLFVKGFSDLTSAFDRGALSDVFGWYARGVANGVRAVDKKLLDEARGERGSNMNVERAFAGLQFRDDVIVPGRPWTFDSFSPHVVVGARSRVPVLSYSGWFDAALSRGQLEQFQATRAPGSRIRMGPWFHSSFFNASPYASSRADWPEHGSEVLRFFDQHLRGIETGIDREPPIQYYTMGTERWRGADAWPPPGSVSQSFYFASGSKLSSAVPDTNEAEDRYEVDPAFKSGAARWGLVVGSGRERRYEDRREITSELLAYTSQPLSSALEVTGAPQVEIFLSANADDGGVFAYLEDVAPDGRIRYVTEGQLRLLHRATARTFSRADARPLTPGVVARVAFDLLPTSYRFPAGHSIRLAIAGADSGAFTVPSASVPLVYAVHRDMTHPSHLTLPVYPQ